MESRWNKDRGEECIGGGGGYTCVYTVQGTVQVELVDVTVQVEEVVVY